MEAAALSVQRVARGRLARQVRATLAPTLALALALSLSLSLTPTLSLTVTAVMRSSTLSTLSC